MDDMVCLNIALIKNIYIYFLLVLVFLVKKRENGNENIESISSSGVSGSDGRKRDEN